jgi:hypothetical protein
MTIGETWLRREGTKVWCDEILGKGFRNIAAEIDVTRIVRYKNKEQ